MGGTGKNRYSTKIQISTGTNPDKKDDRKIVKTNHTHLHNKKLTKKGAYMRPQKSEKIRPPRLRAGGR